MAQSPTPADSDELYSVIQCHIADINGCIVSADVTKFASEQIPSFLYRLRSIYYHLIDKVLTMGCNWGHI